MRTSEHGGVSDTVSLLLTLASERWMSGNCLVVLSRFVSQELSESLL